MTFRGIHGSVRIGFVPNPEPTRSHWVGGWTTSRRSPKTLGRVRLGSGGQRSGRLKSEWVSTTRSSLNLHRKSPNLHRISPNLHWICWFFFGFMWQPRDQSKKDHLKPKFERELPFHRRIFAGSVDLSSDLCDNHRIEAKNTTSSPDLSENFHLIAGSNQKLPNLHRIWVDLGRSDLLSRVTSVGSGSSGFGEDNPPSNPPKSVFRGKDSQSTVTGGSVGFWVSLGGLGGWVDFRFLVDSPNDIMCQNFTFFVLFVFFFLVCQCLGLLMMQYILSSCLIFVWVFTNEIYYFSKMNVRMLLWYFLFSINMVESNLTSETPLSLSLSLSLSLCVMS